MKKTTKISLFLLVILIFINSFSTVVIANNDIDEQIGKAEEFLNLGKDAKNPIDPKASATVENFIYNILLLLGIAVALIWGMILGIKFVMGTIEEKVDVKKGLIAYLIGCIVIFGAFGIWKIIVSILSPLA